MQQADGVSGGGGVEEDVVVVASQFGVHQQGRELVKGGDFGGAGAGQLLFHAAHHLIGQHAARRADDAFAVGLGRAWRVDLQRR